MTGFQQIYDRRTRTKDSPNQLHTPQQYPFQEPRSLEVAIVYQLKNFQEKNKIK